MTRSTLTDGVRISDVIVGTRARKDLGDVHDLVKSISELGLLHPIVITKDRRLIAGHRRLEACARLGWEAIPATTAAHLVDAVDLLRAEQDENTCRKDMTPSEKVALAEALRDLMKAEARRRQHELGRTHGTPSENFSEGSKRGEVREQLAALVGLSHPTYHRARHVVEMTEHADPEIRQVAEQAREEMDRTGKISPAFRKVAEATGRATGYGSDTKTDPEPNGGPLTRAERADVIREMAAQSYTSRQIAGRLGLTDHSVRRTARLRGIEITADKVVGKTRRHDPNRIVRQSVYALEGLVMGLGLVDVNDLDRAEVTAWATSLADSSRALNRFVKQVKEIAHER